MSPTKTTAPDASVSYFYMKADLAIDPPLKDAVIKSHNGGATYLKLKQKKDEDVRVVNGEIAVVTTNITSVAPEYRPDSYSGEYAVFKKEFEALVQAVAANGSTITGYIVCRRLETEPPHPEFFRLVPENGKVLVQSAVLCWPDGTTLPTPTGEGLS